MCELNICNDSGIFFFSVLNTLVLICVCYISTTEHISTHSTHMHTRHTLFTHAHTLHMHTLYTPAHTLHTLHTCTHSTHAHTLHTCTHSTHTTHMHTLYTCTHSTHLHTLYTHYTHAHTLHMHTLYTHTHTHTHTHAHAHSTPYILAYFSFTILKPLCLSKQLTLCSHNILFPDPPPALGYIRIFISAVMLLIT